LRLVVAAVVLITYHTGMALNLPLSLFLDLVRLSRQRVLKALAGTAGGTTAGGREQQQQQRDLYVPLLQYDQYDDEVSHGWWLWEQFVEVHTEMQRVRVCEL
jgi:hypothetical protein